MKTRLQIIMLTIYIFLFSSISSILVAQPICIPYANGVPGTLLWQKAPNWWDPTPGTPLYDTSLDAPSWRGALAVTHDGTISSTSEHIRFRVLHNIEGGIKYLYLSWHVKVVPDLNHDNLLYVGFRDPVTAGEDVVLKIAFAFSGAPTDLVADNDSYYDATAWVKSSSAPAGWDTYPTGGAPPAVPAWLTNTTRVWMTTISSSPQQTWAIQMRIPIATNTDLNNGIFLNDNFRFCFELRAGHTSGGGPGPDFGEYKWPGSIAGFGSDPTSTSPETHTGGTENWQDVSLSTVTPGMPDPGCSSEGITIRVEDIGTLNTSPHHIRVGATNTFFASPRNQTTTAVSGIKARFRLANWGTQAIWEDILVSPTPPLWDDIADPMGVPVAGITLPAANPADPVGSPGQATISFDWMPDPSLYQSECGAAANPAKKRCHQCLLVDISGPGGLTFLNSSVYRNMDMVPASKFSREAEINIRGLASTPTGDPRDVYLFIQTFNMPENIDDNIREQYNSIPTHYWNYWKKRDIIKTKRDSINQNKPPSYKELMKTVPTYIVHSFYDTGRKTDVGGAILKPMTSFGYFIRHEGDLEGWTHFLEGAEKITDNYYKLAVPNNGFATIKTTIEAVEHEIPCWIWILILIILIVIVIVLIIKRRKS